VLEQLAEAEEAIGAAGRAHGLLVVGAPAFVLQNCIGPALPRFHARYPDVELDLRIANRVTMAISAVDVFLLFGWVDAPDMVQKVIGQTRYSVLASPGYWSAHGMPARPRDLEGHQCFAFRNPLGTLLDLWEFRRGKEESR
jgi:DNA-binding transcriptional LysR family regulator